MARAKHSDQNQGQPPLSRTLVLGSVGFLLLLAAGGLIFADWYSVLPADTHATYVGRQSCVSCHQQQAKLFENSHHDKAMDRATPESVLGDFNDAELEHFGIRSRMYKDGERFMVRTEGPDGKLADFEVKYVLGVDPLQNYMVEFDRPQNMPENEIARLQVLRISWDTRAEKWFYLSPPDVFDPLAPDDELHWCGITQRWNTSCAECHSTNVQKNFSEAELAYHTTYSEIDVSCEACHGPGSTHVKLAESKSLFWDRKLGYGLTTNLKDASNEKEVQVCAECHARRQTLNEDYDPGDNYWDHYSTHLLSSQIYQADGQVEDEVFEHGSFLQSKMYHKNIRCTDCHEPHSAKLKHEGNELCTSCHQHPAGKYDTPLHHHHKEGSKGASCAECHMPITNYMEVHGRRDHSLRVPRPDISVELGTSNACTACHLEQDKLREAVRKGDGELHADRLKQYLHFVQAARKGDKTVVSELARVDQWAADAIEKWYGKKSERTAKQHYGFALDAARRNAPNASKQLAEIVKRRTYPAIVRATALQEWAELGDAEALEASIKQLDDAHPLVRAIAATNLASLEDQKQRVEFLLPLLKDPDFVVRRIAARALATSEDSLSGGDASQLRIVLNEWMEGLRANNDRAGAHTTIGDLHLQMRRFREAMTAYREAIYVEPQALGARSQLAALLEALAADQVIQPSEHPQVRQEVLQLRKEELALLRRDAERAPELGVVQYRFGRELITNREFEEAVEVLEKAVKLEPTILEYRLYLAQALFLSGDKDEANAELERVLKRDPDNADALELTRQFNASN